MLLEEYLKPRGLSQVEPAHRMGKRVQVVNAVVHGLRSSTAETAILLSRALDTTPEFWLNCQNRWDLWHALRRMRRETARRAS